jgi:hypothetical protein
VSIRRQLLKPTRILLVVAAGLALAVGALLLIRPRIGPTLSGASPSDLSASGIVLLNPFPWDTPQVHLSDAQQTALNREPAGTSSSQSALAEVIETHGSSKLPRLCWVFSLPGNLVLTHGPPGSPRGHATYYLVLIDAHTGEFVQGVAGGTVYLYGP